MYVQSVQCMVQPVQCMYSLCSAVCQLLNQLSLECVYVSIVVYVCMYVGRASRACEPLFCVNCLMLVSQCMCAVVMCYSVVDVLFVSTYARIHPL